MAHLQPGPAGQRLGSLGLACAILVETAQSNNQTPWYPLMLAMLPLLASH